MAVVVNIVYSDVEFMYFETVFINTGAILIQEIPNCDTDVSVSYPLAWPGLHNGPHGPMNVNPCNGNGVHC